MNTLKSFCALAFLLVGCSTYHNKIVKQTDIIRLPDGTVIDRSQFTDNSYGKGNNGRTYEALVPTGTENVQYNVPVRSQHSSGGGYYNHSLPGATTSGGYPNQSFSSLPGATSNVGGGSSDSTSHSDQRSPLPGTGQNGNGPWGW